MSSLFSGTPVQAPSYTTSTSETPRWMQDAIYNQIQWATNVANAPFQAYSLPRVAELSPLQQQAYSQVQANQGAWAPAMQQSQTGTRNLADAGTAGNLVMAQAPYLSPATVGSNLQAAEGLFGQAAGLSGAAAAQPYLQQAASTTAQSLADRALTAAQPYLGAAGQTAATQVGQYMSPYQAGVLDVIAQRGARNLSENLLPAVSDAFVRAGQFGSSRMGEFGSRALRDTQEAILREQSLAAQQGYTGALGAAQTDLARQAQLAGTVGSISGADLSRILQGGGQYANLGQTAGQLTAQQAQQLAALGTARSQAAQAQQQFGLGAAGSVQQATASDYARQLAAYNQLADMARTEQGMRAADVAALESAGLAQQQQMQRQMDTAYQQYEQQRLYPQQQLDWLSTQVRGMAPIAPVTQTTQGATTQFGPSPLSQLATGLYAARGLSSLG
jgi:hypothetical protein